MASVVPFVVQTIIVAGPLSRGQIKALIASVKKHVTNGKWWFETTSFYAFGSTSTIDAIAASVKAGIRPDRDLVVIGKPDYKTGRVIGKCEDQDIFSLIPFMKKV